MTGGDWYPSIDKERDLALAAGLFLCLLLSFVLIV